MKARRRARGAVSARRLYSARPSYAERAPAPERPPRLKAQVVRDAFNRGGALQSRLLGYAHALFIEAAQSAACNAHHHVEERLARWLLTSSDGVESDDLPLTQEFIATMLGVRRRDLRRPHVEGIGAHQLQSRSHTNS